MRAKIHTIVTTTAALLALVAAPSGCGKSSSTQAIKAPEAALAAGWKKHTADDVGFSIHLPEAFTVLDPKDPQIEKTMQDLIAANPQMEGTIRQALTSANFVYWAFDLKDMQGGFAKNLNVISENSDKLPKNQAEVDDIMAKTKSMLPSSAQVASATLVDLPIGKMMKTEMDFELQGPGGTVRSHSFGYAVPCRGKRLTFTFSCLQTHQDKFRPIVEQAMATYRPLE